MSLTDKVIKNTYYHLLSQALSFLSPLILIPVIISQIGSVEFGIYVLVLGFIGSFGLLDISLSSSFVKFISEFYNKNDKQRVLFVINTGFVFYLVFSLCVVLIAYFNIDLIISLINIPEDKIELAKTAFLFALGIFFLSSTFTIFNSIIIALQKMYIGAIASMFVSFAYFVTVIILMYSGYGLLSIMMVQLASSVVSIIITLVIAKKCLPYLKVNPFLFNSFTFRSMGSFGLQMQVSRLATFASEKYDEFLLGAFTNLSNVTFYNLGSKSASYGRYVPLQIIAPLAPAAAELSAKNETEKLRGLFLDTTKYLNSISIPIFVFLFVFADHFFLAWMGAGYDTSALILRILAVGFLLNFMLSVPGNIIIPNTGKPKYQMFEGLIYLGINLVLSYILIINYGIAGAAIGNVISVIISSVYIFYTSNIFFKTQSLNILYRIISKPLLYSVICSILLYLLYYWFSGYIELNERFNAIVTILILSSVYVSLYFILLFKSRYFDARDKSFFLKIMSKFGILSKTFTRSGERSKVDEN
jgi:O-antigen/teichoic acid export membrane protein